MPKKKKSAEGEETKKTEVAVTKKKTSASKKPKEKPTAITPSTPLDLWRAFDDVFGRFRSDFEDLLFSIVLGYAVPDA